MKNTLWIGLLPPGKGATYLRKKFTLEQIHGKVKCRISGLGFYELYINRKKVGNGRLDPVFSRYDVRTYFRELDVSDYLVPGENICEIHLGRGWYAGDYTDVYASHFASYRHLCKAALRMFDAHGTILETSEDWQAASGPVISDSPRTGETFDARLQDSLQWVKASRLMPPGGKLSKLVSAAVALQPPIAPIAVLDKTDRVCCYDFAVNLTGTVKMEVRGSSGSQVILRYGELYDPSKGFSQDNINWYMDKEKFQTDRYILRGDEKSECWIPSFSYHGFRYVQAEVVGNAEILDLQALPLRSNFAQLGKLNSSSRELNKLLEITERSLSSNFIGYPSDCPHREKNGWLADAHLAAESMLVWYDASKNYNDFIDIIFDYQRPNGQLPGMVPGSGFGWHWDFGPVWTVAPIMLAYNSYMYKNDLSPVRHHYRKMVKYLDFCWNLRRNGLVEVGPAEWKQADSSQKVKARIVDSAMIINALRCMSLFAALLNKPDDQKFFNGRIAELADNLQNEKPGSITELAMLICCGCGSREMALQLEKMVKQDEYRANCGIVGAKYIPRALAEYGFIDTAYNMFTQHQYPGWQWMIDHGATTLWENWRGDESQNHPMMGDVAAWAVRYLGGIKMLEPQFRKFEFAPQMPDTLDSFSWKYKLQGGTLAISWQKLPGNKVEIKLAIPQGASAEFSDPGKGKSILQPGEYTFCRDLK